jgi:hypothetical protein
MHLMFNIFNNTFKILWLRDYLDRERRIGAQVVYVWIDIFVQVGDFTPIWLIYTYKSVNTIRNLPYLHMS